jgi:hypothetical protein
MISFGTRKIFVRDNNGNPEMFSIASAQSGVKEDDAGQYSTMDFGWYWNTNQSIGSDGLNFWVAPMLGVTRSLARPQVVVDDSTTGLSKLAHDFHSVTIDPELALKIRSKIIDLEAVGDRQATSPGGKRRKRRKRGGKRCSRKHRKCSANTCAATSAE